MTGMNARSARRLLSWRLRRDQLLARTGFAQDHHRGVRGGDGINQPPNLLHGGGLADQERHPLGGLQTGFERSGLVRHVAPFRHAVQDHLELGPLARFRQIIERPQSQRLDCGVDRGVAGQDDHLSLGARLANLAENLNAGQSRHPQVKQRRVVEPRLERLERRCAVGTYSDFMTQTGQLHLHQVSQVGFIVGK